MGGALFAEPDETTSASTRQDAPTRQRIGPIVLLPGVSRREIVFYLIATITLAFAAVFNALMQPVLLNQQLGVPIPQQGMLTGMLSTTQQLGVLVAIGVAGAVADALGRKVLILLAMTGFTLCLLTYPFVASVMALFAIRFAWGMVTAAHIAGGATKMLDYPEESSRGKFISLVTIVYAGLIAVFNGYFASHLASWYRSAGLSSADATRGAFWTIALIVVAGFVSTYCFLQDDRPARPKVRVKRARGEIWRAWKAVLGHARTDRRFAAVLLISSVIRTDSAVLSSFLGLWVVQAGRHGGIDPIEATKTIGLLLSAQNITSLCTAPFFGWLSDKVDRLRILFVSLVVMGLAFCSLGLIRDVFSPWMFVSIVFIGLAESCQALTAYALLGEAAPKAYRGVAMGMFTWFGVASVLVINLVAGSLFDRLAPSAPFVMEGLLCLGVFVALVLLMRRR